MIEFKPYIGAIVHYIGWDFEHTHCAAIVTHVHSAENVGLHMFPKPEWVGEQKEKEIKDTSGKVVGWHARGGKVDIDGVLYSDQPDSPNSWHWPSLCVK